LVKGCGEKHPLGACTGLVQQAPDGGQEAKVRHVVGLVYDSYLDCAEPATPLLYQVFQSAWTSDEDVRAAHQRRHLGALGKAAVHCSDPQPSRPGERQKGGGHLSCELARRYEHEGAGLFGLHPVGGSRQSSDDGDCEGQGLTASGTGAAEDISAF